MHAGAITDYIDVAQLVLYLFWIFFFALLLYLRREDKREGYPLQSERSTRISVQGFPRMPSPKLFRLAHGDVTVPNPAKDVLEVRAQPLAPWPGAPLEPTGNPMTDGVGPAASTRRANTPDLTTEGEPMIVPLSVATDFLVSDRDPDPRGMEVCGADRVAVGTVRDVWIDRTEPQIRYLEVALDGAAQGNVLVPIGFARIDAYRRRVRVRAILARQFAAVPRTQHPKQITLDEEDRITAYYGGGTLYAEADRLGPWL